MLYFTSDAHIPIEYVSSGNLRMFRKPEGITPTQYRTAFFQKKVNKHQVDKP